jgi:hypothetical protein
MDDVLAMMPQIRACRCTNGWRPCRAMENTEAEQDIWELSFLLVYQEVYTDMLLWALERAATGQWRIPSANEHNGVTTRDVTLRVRIWSTRGATRELSRSGQLSVTQAAAGTRDW